VPRVAIATADAVRETDEDWPLLSAALARAGATPELAAWDDPGVDWAAYDGVVVRSTWDYVGRREQFLAWAERVAGQVPFANPPAVLRWSTDKRYLEELAGAGVPVVPTTFLVPGALIALPDAEEWVVKPTDSAGSRDTARHADPDAARRHIAHLQATGRTAMVQPYLQAIDDEGETAVIHLAGTYSHTARKAAILRPGAAFVEGLFASEHITPREPTPAQRAVAEAAIAAAPGPLLYARVDLVPGPGGEPLLLELELAEPSLFLDQHPSAADTLAAAILALR
jgi:glutathione synthase/RimK-type ligase-like ATP-grasp enzyme